MYLKCEDRHRDEQQGLLRNFDDDCYLSENTIVTTEKNLFRCYIEIGTLDVTLSNL
jgi:hypothetical protein